MVSLLLPTSSLAPGPNPGGFSVPDCGQLVSPHTLACLTVPPTLHPSQPWQRQPVGAPALLPCSELLLSQRGRLKALDRPGKGGGWGTRVSSALSPSPTDSLSTVHSFWQHPVIFFLGQPLTPSRSLIHALFTHQFLIPSSLLLPFTNSSFICTLNSLQGVLRVGWSLGVHPSFIHPCLHPFVHLPICQPICPTFLFIYPPIIYPFTHSFVYLSTHLPL